MIKHHAFHSEKEYRIVIYKKEENNDKIKIDTDSGSQDLDSLRNQFEYKNNIKIKNIAIERKIAKLKFNYENIPIKEIIKKIIVSPIGDYQDINVDFLRRFIKSDPKYDGIEVTKSDIPHQ